KTGMPARKQGPPGLPRRVDQEIEFTDRRSRRFFEQDMLAGPQRRVRLEMTPLRRRTQRHGIDIRHGQQQRVERGKMRDAGNRCIAAGDGGKFDAFGAGDCRDMLIAGDLAEPNNGEANGGHAAVPAFEASVDALPSQHTWAATASGLDQVCANGWIDFDRSAKIVPFWMPSIPQSLQKPADSLAGHGGSGYNSFRLLMRSAGVGRVLVCRRTIARFRSKRLQGSTRHGLFERGCTLDKSRGQRAEKGRQFDDGTFMNQPMKPPQEASPRQEARPARAPPAKPRSGRRFV